MGYKSNIGFWFYSILVPIHRADMEARKLPRMFHRLYRRILVLHCTKCSSSQVEVPAETVALEGETAALEEETAALEETVVLEETVALEEEIAT